MAIQIVLLFTFVAAMFDIKTRRIPNKLIIVMIIASLLINFIDRSYIGLFRASAYFIVTIVVMLPIFAKNYLGAGDIKLIAAVSSFLGFVAVLNILVYIALIGGFYAAVLLLKKKLLLRDEKISSGIPYAVPIFFGVFVFATMGGCFFV